MFQLFHGIAENAIFCLPVSSSVNANSKRPVLSNEWKLGRLKA